jgi:hypothetical protein
MTIIIGDPVVKPIIQYKQPLRHLPQRLDAAACLEVLARIDQDPLTKTDSVLAARKSLTVELIDDALEYTELSTSDRIRFKYALTQVGILSVGKKV